MRSSLHTTCVLTLTLLFLSITSFASEYDLEAHKTKTRAAKKWGVYYMHAYSQFQMLPQVDNSIIFLGNSITDGGNWSEWFANPKVLNRGISGDRTTGILNRLKEVTDRKPAKLFIMIGVNDISKGITNDSIMKNYTEIINRVKKESPNTIIHIESVLPINTDYYNGVTTSALIDDLNSRLKNLAKEKSITFINLDPTFKNKEGLLREDVTCDGLHLSGLGYKLWVDVVKEYVNK